MDYNHLCLGCFCINEKDPKICPFCGFDKDTYNQEASGKMYLPAGTVLQGNYLLGRMLGTEGFVITYLGFQLNLDRMVVIEEFFPFDIAVRSEGKGLSGEGFYVRLSDPGAEELFDIRLDCFEEEGRTLASIDLPGIVGIHDCFRENHTAYHVMRYVHGQKLKDYLEAQGGKLAGKDILRLFAPVIQSLGKIHKMGFIHRAICPGNFMLDMDGELVLVNFGAAGTVSDLRDPEEKRYSLVLKPGYSPLEQYNSDGLQGPWTDVYGVCAVIYRMLTGKQPEDVTVRYQNRDDETGLREELLYYGVSRNIADAVIAGMKILYSERIQTMEALWEQLNRYAEKGIDPESNVCEKKKSISVFKIAAVTLFAAAVCFLLFRNYELKRRSREDNSGKLLVNHTGPELSETDQMETYTQEPESGSEHETQIISEAEPPEFPEREPATTAEILPEISSERAAMTSALADKASASDTIVFGSYEQDNDESDGQEPVEWLILKKDEKKALLISRYILDCTCFHKEHKPVTWEECSLREWLNSTFLTTAFNELEREFILTTRVIADKNSSYSINPGKDVQDKIFLLSLKEAEGYFDTDSARACDMTEYAITKGTGKACWWLRTPGYSPDNAAYVFTEGDLCEDGITVRYEVIGVRPAMWIALKP